MSDHLIISDLKRLGFTEYEAKVYMETLAASGEPMTAYQISKLSGVPRSNTYSALEVLAQKGFVLPVTENPTCYIAAHPRNIFSSVASQTASVCERVTKRLERRAPSANNQYVWILSDEEHVDFEIEKLLKSSKSSIWIKASDLVLRRHSHILKKVALQRDVNIVIVLFGKDKSEFEFSKNCKVYLHENEGTRMGKADNLFTIVVDFDEMITVSVDKNYVGARTQSKAIVTLALSLIRHDFYMAKIFEKFGEEIINEFGPHLAKLRLSVYTPEQAESFYENTGYEIG